MGIESANPAKKFDKPNSFQTEEIRAAFRNIDENKELSSVEAEILKLIKIKKAVMGKIFEICAEDKGFFYLLAAEINSGQFFTEKDKHQHGLVKLLREAGYKSNTPYINDPENISRPELTMFDLCLRAQSLTRAIAFYEEMRAKADVANAPIDN